jgi:hypothetical protein
MRLGWSNICIVVTLLGYAANVLKKTDILRKIAIFEGKIKGEEEDKAFFQTFRLGAGLFHRCLCRSYL